MIVYILSGIIVVLVILLAIIWFRIRSNGASNKSLLMPFAQKPVVRERRTEYYDDNESVKMTYECIGNDKDGTEELFYPSGKLNRTRVWHRGVLHGEMTVYYESGNVYIKGNYKKGALTGEYTVYKENGGILTVKRY